MLDMWFAKLGTSAWSEEQDHGDGGSANIAIEKRNEGKIGRKCAKSRNGFCPFPSAAKCAAIQVVVRPLYVKRGSPQRVEQSNEMPSCWLVWSVCYKVSLAESLYQLIAYGED